MFETNDQGEFVRWIDPGSLEHLPFSYFPKPAEWKRQMRDLEKTLRTIDPEDCREICLLFEKEFGYDLQAERQEFDRLGTLIYFRMPLRYPPQMDIMLLEQSLSGRINR
jgi:hypothetical protein